MRREIEVYNPKREARLEMQLRRRTEELNENLRFQGLLYETIFVLAVLLIATVFALLVVTSNRFLGGLMGKYKEIQIEVSDEVYSALEQLADDLNKAETIILNRTGKQELIGQRSMTVEHIALLSIETYVHNIEKRKCQKPDPLGYTE